MLRDGPENPLDMCVKRGFLNDLIRICVYFKEIEMPEVDRCIMCCEFVTQISVICGAVTRDMCSADCNAADIDHPQFKAMYAKL